MTKHEYRHYSHQYRNADRLRAQAERYFQDSCAKYWACQQIGFSMALPGDARRVTGPHGETATITEQELVAGVSLTYRGYISL